MVLPVVQVIMLDYYHQSNHTRSSLHRLLQCYRTGKLHFNAALLKTKHIYSFYTLYAKPSSMLEAVITLETSPLQRALILPFRSNPHKCRGPTSNQVAEAAFCSSSLFQFKDTDTANMPSKNTVTLLYDPISWAIAASPLLACAYWQYAAVQTLGRRDGMRVIEWSELVSRLHRPEVAGYNETILTLFIIYISWETVLSRYVYSLLLRIPSSSSLTIFHLHQHSSFSNEIKMHGIWTSIYSLQLWAICFR